MSRKKRKYKRSEDNKSFRKPKNRELAIKQLEETGELKDYLSPYMINDRLVYQHDKILKSIELLEKIDKNKNFKRQQCLNNYKKECQRKFLNLCSIIIYANIKRYHSIGKQSEDLVSQAQLDILENLFVKKSYKKNKSMLSSQIYEITKQTILQYIAKEMKVENSKVNLLI